MLQFNKDGNNLFKKRWLLAFSFFCFINASAFAQELFSFTEPASNMSAKSMGLRMNVNYMKGFQRDKNSLYISPEIMIGISRKIMIHGETFFSNQQQQFQFKGASFYAKYRLFSIDDVHSHFRMAAFGRVASNNSPMHTTAIVLNGSTAGVESGLVATKLLNKVAMSSSFSFVHSFSLPSLNSPNEIHNHLLLPNQKNAVNYTLSIGKLMLPKHYVNYNQVNVNGMLELLGQTNLGLEESYIDIAPSVQFIFKSKMRIDLGYSTPLVSDLTRVNSTGFLLRFEFNLFNIFN